MSADSETPPPGGQFLVYSTEDGKLKIDVRFEGETVWLTQQHMAELFLTTKQNIGQHLKGIFAEGELVRNSVVKESFTTAADGKNYATKFYNMDVIQKLNARAILPDAGKVSRDEAHPLAEQEYERFAARRRAALEVQGEPTYSDFSMPR
jgi:hypothetical protein